MGHQSGITAIGLTDHAFVELDLVPGADPEDAVAQLAAAADLPTTKGANVVVGVRPSMWELVAPEGAAPEGVHDFEAPIEGPGGYSMPATQHEAWLWIATNSRSNAFDLAAQIRKQIAPWLVAADQTVGWVYENNRDLTGFEDGTENPTALEAPALVEVPAGKPGAGSTVLLFQLWEHKAHDWESLSVHDQEMVIGRTKADSIEFDDDVKPESSHVARTVVEVDGEELDVFRRNVAYGDNDVHGTVFVGFTLDQWRMEEMLRRMAGADGGPRDELTRFTDPVSGSWYVCPSTEVLAELAAKVEPEDD